MYLDKAKKEEIFEQNGKSKVDTGSAESQIALFTYRIQHLTEHVKRNHKDFVTTRSLTQLVGIKACLNPCKAGLFFFGLSCLSIPSCQKGVRHPP
ncbi:MAG: 30S ribosomal protein S15 [Prevotella sp.]